MALRLLLTQDHRPEQTFDRAYRLYPRKEARKDGMKAWIDLNPDDQLVSEIVTSITWQAHQWVVVERREQRHIPLFGTYIRGERWTDERPPNIEDSRAALRQQGNDWIKRRQGES